MIIDNAPLNNTFIDIVAISLKDEEVFYNTLK